MVPSPSEPAPRALSTAAGGRLARLGLAGALVGGLVVSGAPLCPIAYLTGFPCPGCGLTRAGLSLSRGDLAGAIASSPLSIVVVPAFAWLVARSALLYARGRDPSPPAWATRAAVGLWAALIVVWALRFAGFFGGPVPVRSVWG